MKPKIDLDKIASMTFDQYQKLFKKEVARAKKIGLTNCVMICNFEFSDKTVGTILILGHYTGKLEKFYKHIKKQRKSKNDFAVGTAVLEDLNDGSTTLHIAIDSGKAKPKELHKNGKNLFKKVGIAVNIFKGELSEQEMGTVSEEEIETMDLAGQKLSDDKKMKQLIRSYQKLVTDLFNVVAPNVKANASTPKDLLQSRKALILVNAIESEYQTLSEKQQKKWQENYEVIINKKSQILNLFAKAKSIVMANNDIQSPAIQGAPEEDINVVLDQPFHELTQQVKAIEEQWKLIQQQVIVEKSMPIERTALKTTIDLLEAKINTTQQQLNNYTGEGNISATQTKITDYTTRLDSAKKAYQQFEAIRVKELADARNLLDPYQKMLEELDLHIQKMLKANEVHKTLLKYEFRLLEEYLELLQKVKLDFQKLPNRVQQTLAKELLVIETKITTAKNIQSTYSPDSDPTNKDKRYKKLPNLNMKGSLDDLQKQLAALDKFMDRAEANENEVGDRIVNYFSNLSSGQKQPGGDCFAVAKSRVKAIWKQITKEDLYKNLPPSPISGVTSSKFFNMVWNCNTIKEIPALYNGKGSAGAMVWAGKGDFVEQEDIWKGKLKPGAVVQVWANKSDFELVAKGEKPLSYGHSFIFLEYMKENDVIIGMKIADQGTGWDTEGVYKETFDYFIGANLK